ncbi:MAG: FecR domain-containing protein, partial [Gemmatimonadales bacterium]
MPPDEELPQPARQEWDVDAMWSRVRTRTLDAAERAQPATTARYPWRRMSALAAAAAIVAVVGALAWPALARLRRADSARTTAPAQYRTTRGQYATIHLTDGSEVTLAPESRLAIAALFGNSSRDVKLDGEAIFSVKHDAAHAFRVSAGGALIEDIGT